MRSYIEGFYFVDYVYNIEGSFSSSSVVVVLVCRCIELAEDSRRTYSLLNSHDHRSLLKRLNREPDDIRPDITHQ